MKLTMKIEGVVQQPPDEWGTAWSGGPIKPFELSIVSNDIETLLALVETSIENSVDSLPGIKALREEVEDVRRIGNDNAQLVKVRSSRLEKLEGKERQRNDRLVDLEDDFEKSKVNLDKAVKALAGSRLQENYAKAVIRDMKKLVAGSGRRYPRGLKARVEEALK